MEAVVVGVLGSLWRHFVQEDDAGGGGSIGDTSFPYGPADPASGDYYPPPPPPPPPPTPPTYPIGPPSSKSYYHASATNSAPPPPDPWAGVASSVHSQAFNILEQFEKVVGWPQGFDENAWELKLAKSGTNITSSQLDAFQWLYDNSLSSQQQKDNPWAQYGMDKDTYNVTVQKMDSTFFDWTGDQLSAQGVGKNSGMWQAIRGNWLPDQIKNFAIYGNPTGSGPVLAQAQATGDMPWLSQGQTYSQSLAAFEAFEQSVPTDKATLAAFWRFGNSAKQLGGATEAIATASKALIPGTAVR